MVKLYNGIIKFDNKEEVPETIEGLTLKCGLEILNVGESHEIFLADILNKKVYGFIGFKLNEICERIKMNQQITPVVQSVADAIFESIKMKG